MDPTRLEPEATVPPAPETAGDAETAESAAAASILDSLERAESAETFFRGLLHGQLERSEALHGAIWLRAEPEGQKLRLLYEEPARVSRQAAMAWREPLAREASAVLLSGQRHVQRVSEPADRLLQGRVYWGMGLPVPVGNKTVAVVTLVMVGEEHHVLEYARVAAESVASQGLLYGTLQASQQMQQRFDEMCKAWDLVAATNMGYPDPEHMALGLVNKAKDICNASRVSLGWARRGKVKLAAISDQDYIDRRTNLSRALAAAMQEAREEDRTVFFPPDDPEADEDTDESLHAHGLVADLAEDHAVATHPLRAGEEVVAALVIERRENRPFSQGERRLQGIACEQLGPALGLGRQNARGVLARCRDGVVSLFEKLVGKGHLVAKLVTLAAIALALVGVFATWPMKISGEARLAPAVRRVYAAPFDRAILRETQVLPGELVRTGDILFRFETEEMDLELQETRSQLAAAQKKMDVYFSEQKMAEYKIAQSEAEELKAKVNLLEHRIEQAVVRASFDGIVLEGDLRQHVGSPFQMGQVLLEVAPLQEMLLLMEVGQDDIGYVESGSRGTFVTKARPDVPLDFEVEKVRPMSEARENENVFVVEAHMHNAEGWLRPGMEGAANVKAGHHNIAWVFTRKPINWLRMKLFF
jgi:hypothetical protein